MASLPTKKREKSELDGTEWLNDFIERKGLKPYRPRKKTFFDPKNRKGFDDDEE